MSGRREGKERKKQGVDGSQVVVVPDGNMRASLWKGVMILGVVAAGQVGWRGTELCTVGSYRVVLFWPGRHRRGDSPDWGAYRASISLCGAALRGSTPSTTQRGAPSLTRMLVDAGHEIKGKVGKCCHNINST